MPQSVHHGEVTSAMRSGSIPETDDAEPAQKLTTGHGEHGSRQCWCIKN